MHICETEEEAFRLEAEEINKAMKEGHLLLNTQVPEQRVEKLVQLDIEAEKPVLEMISNFVRRKRRELKLTQVEFANRAGVGLRFVRELEHGKPTMRLDKVNQAIKLFGACLVPYVINRKA